MKNHVIKNHITFSLTSEDTEASLRYVECQNPPIHMGWIVYMALVCTHRMESQLEQSHIGPASDHPEIVFVAESFHSLFGMFQTLQENFI